MDGDTSDRQAAPPVRFGHVDSLRLIGAVAVAAYHFLEGRAPSPAIQAVLTSGLNTAVVVIFFFISGYVMPFTVRRGVELRSVLVRRAFRLLPLYYVALFVIVIGGLTGALDRWRYIAATPLSGWIPNLLLVQDFVGARPFLGVSWTLAIEFIWYFTFFAGVAMFKHRAATVLGIAAPLGMIALALLSLALDMRIPLGRPAMIYAAVLGWQMYLAVQGDLSGRAIAGWIGLFIAVTTATNYVAFGHFAHVHAHLLPVTIAWTAATLIFAVVVLSPRLRSSSLFAHGMLPMAGLVSYSIYLLHPIVIVALHQYLPAMPMMPQFALYVVLTGAIATFGYRLVEVPGIAWGKRLATGSSKPEAGLASA